VNEGRASDARRDDARPAQWQEHPPPQHPPPDIVEATAPPSLLKPKTESFRVTLVAAQDGQATAAVTPWTYFSNSASQSRQRYS
jgi:hypothetical protein